MGNNTAPEPGFLVTKYTVPPARSVLLHRSHLLEMLNLSRSVPLTLLSAPAGFGKTTLLSTWASQNTGMVAWLALDEHDNDPARFWAYVIAALRKVDAPVGETVDVLLRSPSPSLLTSALTSLVNELAACEQDIALILDDYHLIHEQVIHDSLHFVLGHLPLNLHLLLASRVDPAFPLARLRARGQVIEIRETDLRLYDEEAARFLTQVMGLTLAEEEISRLQTRTEGWITGLQLAGLSLRRHANTAAFLQAFTGSHRFILDYVQEEILEPLPEEQQRFLLYTSVLTRINAGICQSLTGELASQQMLEDLERANLFLIPLDEERYWYRFHTLFREVLLARLEATQPEQVSRLHREAALWYLRQGGLHEAIPHALATRDFVFVAELLEGCVDRLSLQGELNTLLAWIKQLPLEVLRLHPRLVTNYLLVFNLLFPFSEQEQEERVYLDQLHDGLALLLQGDDQGALSFDERDQLRKRMMVLDAWRLAKTALSAGDMQQLSQVAAQLQPPELDDVLWQQNGLAPFAMAWRMAGNFPPLVAAIQTILQRTRQTQDRAQETHVLWGLIAALIALGQLRAANNCCRDLQQLIDSLSVPVPLAAYPDLFQAQLAYAWNNLDAAQTAARKAIDRVAPLQYMDILMVAYEVLVRISIIRGDLAGAEQVLGEMEEIHQSSGIPLFHPWIESLRVDLWLAQGNLTRAVDWAERSSYGQELFVYSVYSRETAYLALVRISLAQQRYPQALLLLKALLSSAEQVSRMGSVISLLALQVATLQASGATDEALRALSRLLTMAAPEGYLRVFLDAGEPMRQALQIFLKTSEYADSPLSTSYAQTVLDAFAREQSQEAPGGAILQVATVLPRSSSQTAPQLVTPLTSRELEVLRLLAEGASNREIANQLVVQLSTAKKHVASILSKLGAENRTQAIARARALSLL